MKPAISVLGTGRMGSALARALLQSGYRTTVWNRTNEPTGAQIEKAMKLDAKGSLTKNSYTSAV